jgi:hypothetical protein
MLDGNCYDVCPEGYIPYDTICKRTVKSTSWFSGQGSPLGFLSAFSPIALNWNFNPIANVQNKVLSVQCILKIQNQMEDEIVDFTIADEVFLDSENTTLYYQFDPQTFDNGISVSSSCTGKILSAKIEYLVVSEARMKTIPLPIGEQYI